MSTVPMPEPMGRRVRVVLTGAAPEPRPVRTLREVLGMPLPAPRQRIRRRYVAAATSVGVVLGAIGAVATVHDIVRVRQSDFLHSDIWMPMPDTAREAQVVFEATHAADTTTTTSLGAVVAAAPVDAVASPATATPVARRTVVATTVPVEPVAVIDAADLPPTTAPPAAPPTTTPPAPPSAAPAAPPTTAPPGPPTSIDDDGDISGGGSGKGSGSGSGSGGSGSGRNKPED